MNMNNVNTATLGQFTRCILLQYTQSRAYNRNIIRSFIMVLICVIL